MNIGDSKAAAGLFERIESAYQEALVGEAPAGVDEVAGAGGAAKSAAVDAPSPTSSSAEPWAHLESPVQRGLLKLCADAINGDFGSEEQLCIAVVQTIVEHRFSGPVPAGQSERILKTLSASLVSDPNFRESIEHLLVLAARELA